MKNELFETMRIPRAYMTLALPVILSMVVTLVYNMADTYFIALTGNTNLIAGVSLCAPIFTLMLAFGDIFGLGASSVISRVLGQGHREDVKRMSSFSFYGSMVFGIGTAMVMLLFRESILSFLGSTVPTHEYASAYYSWLVLGSPFLIFSLVPTNVMRSEGAAKESMIGSVLGIAVNIILDPIFIFTL